MYAVLAALVLSNLCTVVLLYLATRPQPASEPVVLPTPPDPVAIVKAVGDATAEVARAAAEAFKPPAPIDLDLFGRMLDAEIAEEEEDMTDGLEDWVTGPPLAGDQMVMPDA